MEFEVKVMLLTVEEVIGNAIGGGKSVAVVVVAIGGVGDSLPSLILLLLLMLPEFHFMPAEEGC